MTDVARAKSATIERALDRVAATWSRAGDTILADFDAQDVLLFNLQRACEAAIDLALHSVDRLALGNPDDSREAFTLLERGAVIDADLADRLRRMVGFRNIAVHEYRRLDWDVVRAVVEREADALRQFASIALGCLTASGREP